MCLWTATGDIAHLDMAIVNAATKVEYKDLKNLIHKAVLKYEADRLENGHE